MDDGIVQFVVISLFVVFSILESVGRRNKAKAARKDVQADPGATRLPAKTPRVLEGGEQPKRAGLRARTRSGSLSDLISPEFWEEVAALAQDHEERPGGQAGVVLDDRSADRGIPSDEAGLLPVAAAKVPAKSHWVVGLEQARTHEVVEYQEDFVPVSAPRQAKPAADSYERRRAGAGLRAELLGSSVSDLRRVVLLYEVLGPPLALRTDGEGRGG